jgi:PHD/YefM family antitoxin component YafN of YafNO toxin-antitoxin module
MSSRRVDIEPISSLKRASEIAERVEKTRRPIYTQNGRASMVVQDVTSYEEREEALAMLKLCLEGERDIREGRAKSVSAFRKSLQARVRARAKDIGLE